MGKMYFASGLIVLGVILNLLLTFLGVAKLIVLTIIVPLICAGFVLQLVAIIGAQQKLVEADQEIKSYLAFLDSVNETNLAARKTAASDTVRHLKEIMSDQ